MKNCAFYFLLVAFISSTLACAQQKQKEVPKSIPQFTFYTLDKGAAFNRNQLAANGKNIVILFFDPGCSHCQQEVMSLGKNYNSIRDVNLYLVAMQEPNLINAFMTTYGGNLNHRANVTLLHDKNYQFIGIFNPAKYPATYVYGPDKTLKAYWDGDKDIKEIIKAFHL